MKTYKAKVGQKILGSFSTEIYSGMNSSSTFAIGYAHHQFGGLGGNLYFPIDASEIIIGNKKFKVINVTPEEIELEQIPLQ